MTSANNPDNPNNDISSATSGLGLDVAPYEDEFVVAIDANGFEEDEVSAVLQNEMLIVRAQKKKTKVDLRVEKSRWERKKPQQTRTVKLPTDVDTSSMEVTYNNGIVTVSFQVA